MFLNNMHTYPRSNQPVSMPIWSSERQSSESVGTNGRLMTCEKYPDDKITRCAQNNWRINPRPCQDIGPAHSSAHSQSDTRAHTTHTHKGAHIKQLNITPKACIHHHFNLINRMGCGGGLVRPGGCGGSSCQAPTLGKERCINYVSMAPDPLLPLMRRSYKYKKEHSHIFLSKGDYRDMCHYTVW